jgi:Protein of unknown function (DUF3631)
VTAVIPELRTASDEELLAVYQAGGTRGALAEAARRDRLDRSARARHAQRDGWEDAARAQYLDAERECRGSLVSARGIAAGASDWSLWSGPRPRALAYATEELRNYWDAHPRVTVTGWRQQVSDGKRIQRGERDRAAYDISNSIREGTGMGIAGSVAGAMARDAARGSARAAERRQSVARRARARGAGRLAAPVAVPGQSAVARQREPADGAQALGYARQFLGHFSVWPSDAALTTAALWAAHAHARTASGTLVWLASPRLLFSSAEPGAGKSHSMRLVARLCPAPAVLTEPSEPALAQLIGKEKATIALDEADVFFGAGSRKAAARAIINDGYTPDGTWARVRKGEVERIPTFGALMLAGLDKMDTGTSGQMEATLKRCIRMRMRRAPRGYRAPRFDDQARFVAGMIAGRLGAWAQQELPSLGSRIPDLPEGIGNREAELWEPLLAVADTAGGPWPGLARDACEEMVATGGTPGEDQDMLSRLDSILASWTGEEDED